MARIDAASLAVGGLSSAVGGVAVNKIAAMLPPQGTLMGDILYYAFPVAVGVGGAYLAQSGGRNMTHDIGEGVQAAGFTVLGMTLARKMIR